MGSALFHFRILDDYHIIFTALAVSSLFRFPSSSLTKSRHTHTHPPILSSSLFVWYLVLLRYVLFLQSDVTAIPSRILLTATTTLFSFIWFDGDCDLSSPPPFSFQCTHHHNIQHCFIRSETQHNTTQQHLRGQTTKTKQINLSITCHVVSLVH